jgi:integrase
LTPLEVEQICEAAGDGVHGAIVHIAVLTGLRQGELLGLRWKDVDLDNGVVQVQQTLQSVAGMGTVIGIPKTPKSRRAVALSPDTINVFREQRRRQAEIRLKAGSAYDDLGYIFATPLGAPIDASNLRRAWRRIVATAGIGHVRFHDLRHTHASLMLLQGTHLKIVSERLGHASIAITADTYSHVQPGLQAAAAARLDQLLRVARSNMDEPPAKRVVE